MTQSTGIAYWINPANQMTEVVFDPWGARDQARNTHAHLHTEWAENIYENHRRNNLQVPALFPEWEEETVVLVGRGQSAKDCLAHLENTSSPKIFLNHAYLDWAPNESDFVAVIDPRFSSCEADRSKTAKLGLITTPGVQPDVIEGYGWRESRGATFWNRAPLNDWMRKMFPRLPQVIECASVSTSILHLAAINKVKRVVCVGWDYCGGGGPVTAMDINGDKVHSTFHHFKASQAVTFFSQIVGLHSDMEIINASGRGLFGLNASVRPPQFIEKIKQVAPSELPQLFKE